jgi:hypothetical protein
MATFTIIEASVGSPVGTNLMAGNRFQISPKYRQVRRIGVVGSAVLRDASVDLFFGDTYIGTYFPTTIGVVIPVDSKDMINVQTEYALEPNEPLNLIVSKISVTNPFAITLEVDEVS